MGAAEGKSGPEQLGPVYSVYSTGTGSKTRDRAQVLVRHIAVAAYRKCQWSDKRPRKTPYVSPLLSEDKTLP